MARAVCEAGVGPPGAPPLRQGKGTRPGAQCEYSRVVPRTSLRLVEVLSTKMA
jgi:hypothetical protein